MMTLLLTEESASELASHYLPKGTALSDEIICDVAGEIANVIAGQAQTILKGTRYHFGLSTPSVAKASSFSRSPGVTGERHMVSVTFEAQRILLIVQLTPCAGS
jgi:CheY-specific phosphatase CheX